MRKTPSILIFLTTAFIAFFVLSNSLQAQEIKIKIENGIQVVYNPKNPAPPPGSPKSLILTEDLCIGEEETEDFVFSSIRTIEVDDDENIYVADSKEVCVKVFDKNGKHIRTFGKKGQGPGEIQFFTRVHMFAGKEIMIYDGGNNRLSFYSLDGEFLREISTGKYRFARAIPDSKGNIIGQVTVFGDRFAYEIKKFDPELNPIIEIATIELERISNVLNMVSPVISVRLMKNDHFAWGNWVHYRLQIADDAGRTTRKIIKDYDPVKITDEDKERDIKERFGDRGIPPDIKLVFPDYYPAFWHLSNDDEGRIFVQTFRRTEEGSYYYDVFDSEGKYIAKVPLKVRPRDWKNNKLYTIEEDEEGYQYVRRYKVIWRY